MPRAGLSLLAIALSVLSAAGAGPPPPEQWIVVTAPAFRAAIAPLAKHRKAQGMRVVVLDTSTLLTPAEIRANDTRKLRTRLQKLCRDHAGPSYILLAGAVTAGGLPQPERAVIPPLSGTIGRMKGEPTDNSYGCLDSTRLPTVAVGRLPARSEAEAEAMVKKVLALENDTKPGLWKRRLTILAGIPAYNPVVDRLIETRAFSRFDRIHPAWSGRVVYTNPHSRFCLPDSQLRKQSLACLGQGQAFILYLGHSNADGLYGGPTASFLDRADWGRLKIPTGAGVFVSFGCNGCQLKGRDPPGARPLFLQPPPPQEEGYGVAAIRNPHGPSAVIGSHGICFAAMGQLAAEGLFSRAFQGAELPRRLGSCWLAMLEGLARGKIDFLSYRMLDAVDGDSNVPQATQRQEHLEMFVLLGDPALRLPEMPADIRLQPLPALVVPGKALRIRGRLPDHLWGARVRITLERSPASQPLGLETLPRLPGAKRDRVMLANHQRANNFVVVEKEVVAKAGAFEALLPVPAKLPWATVLLRVHASTEKGESMAVERLRKAPGTPSR
jgi:hypothetical protein